MDKGHLVKDKQSTLTRYQIRRWALAVTLLAALGCGRLIMFQKPAEADAYFKHVVTVAAATPTSFGSWVSLDAPVPPAAETMLRPNLTVSRRYTNLDTGQQATLLLVECSDARSLNGHYPPVCYPSSGFRKVAASSKDWDIDGLHIEGMIYTFSSARPEELSTMIIYDFMILPDGSTCRDMDGVEAIARNPRERQFGAAQLQILLDPSMPEDQREAIFRTLIHLHRPTIDAILGGEKS
jgi:hypothetical protein